MKKTWSKHEDDEIWMNALFDTEEECIADARACEETGSIFIADCEPYHPTPDVDTLLERLEEDAYEEMSEVAEGRDISCNKTREEAYARLEGAINDAVNHYLDEIDCQPGFFKCRNIHEVVL